MHISDGVLSAESSVRTVIISTHPIQYQAPWFRELSRRPGVQLQVFFVAIPTPEQQGIGFGIPFSWDIPLLEGYSWTALPRVTVYPKRRPFFRHHARLLDVLLKEVRPDLVVVTGWHSWVLLQAAWVCRRLGIPVCVRGESNSLRHRPVWKRMAHRILLSFYDGFLAIGKANRAFYAANCVPGRCIFDAPYFVDNQRFLDQTISLGPSRSELRARWNIPEVCFCFCFVGKFQPSKRVLDILEAARIAANSSRSLWLLLVGTGEQDAEARTFASLHRLPVTFAGFLNQSEIGKAYIASDAVILASSEEETWGLVVNEAMACGLTAIVSDRVGCGPDLVEPGLTGEIFPFGDTKALADAMLKLAAKPELAAKMGKAAQMRVLSDYTIEKTVAGTLSAIATLRRAGGDDPGTGAR